MLQVVKMNWESLIFDSPERDTVNGIPAGYLSQQYRHIVGSDGKPPPIDVHRIVERFHQRDGGAILCSYSGQPSDGINVVDGNPNNFLITNLEPVSKEAMFSIEAARLPKVVTTRIFHGPAMDVEVELFGTHAFRAEDALDKLEIPEIPAELGLAYREAELLWLWNFLTKQKLLKGLTKLSMSNRQTGTSISLTNKTVLDFVLRMLQDGSTLQENRNAEE